MATIGEQITAVHKAKRMTQDALAEKMKMSRQGISHWETDRTKPDAENLQRLAEILECQFHPLGNASPVNAAPSEDGEAALPKDNEQAQGPETAPMIKKPLFKRLLSWIAAAIVVLAVCLFVLPRILEKKQQDIVYTSANGVTYATSEFKKITPNEKGKAYLSVTPKLEIRNPGKNAFYFYTFLLREENGIAFSIKQTQCVQFFASSVGEQFFTGEELRAYELDPEMNALGTFAYEDGQPAFTNSGTRNGIGIGFRVSGVDANGAELTFTGYLPLPQD